MTETALILLFAGIGATVLAAWVAGMALVRTPHRRLDHALVVALGLLLVSLAQLLTGLGFLWDDRELIRWGAILARGALLGTLMYLLVRYPRGV